jgi:hypothetical protein
MFEIFSLNKPIVYLPPKNAGQYEIFNIFKSYGLTDFTIKWEDIYPEVGLLKDSWELMEAVESKMLNDSALPFVLSDRIKQTLKSISVNPIRCSRLVEKQSKFLENISSGSDNLEDCFRNILKGQF